MATTLQDFFPMALSIVALSSFIIFAQSASAQSPYFFPNEAPTSNERPGGDCGSISCDPNSPNKGLITANRVVAIAQQCKAKNPDDLLPLLPKEFRAQTIAAYDSRSTQQGTPHRPRVIVHGPDAKLILAFTDSGQRNGDKIEMIQFRDDGRKVRLQFTELAFPDGQPTRGNSQQCYECHKGLHRWENYPNWTGFFGSTHNGVSRQEAGYLAQLERLKQSRALPPRYQSITLPNTFHGGTEYFGQLIMGLNARVKAQSIKDRPDYLQFRNLAAFELLCGDGGVISFRERPLPGPIVSDRSPRFTEARRRIRGPTSAWTLLPPKKGRPNPQYPDHYPYSDEDRTLDVETAAYLLFEMAKDDPELKTYVRTDGGEAYRNDQDKGSRGPFSPLVRNLAQNNSNIDFPRARSSCRFLERKALEEVNKNMPAPYEDQTLAHHSTQNSESDQVGHCSAVPGTISRPNASGAIR